MHRQGRELRLRYLGERPVWIAGSTHAGEEEQLLEAHAALLVDASRSLVDAGAAASAALRERCESAGAARNRFDRRSIAAAVRPESSVLLVDSVGELAALYAAADVAFVGGSLVPVGGHNLARAGCARRAGDHGPFQCQQQGHRAIAAAVGRRRGSRRCAALARRSLRQLFADPDDEAQSRAPAGAEFVERNRGSVHG